MATIISQVEARSKTRLTFTLSVAGVTYGPMVAHRPIGEDYQAWVNQKQTQLAGSLKLGEIENNIAKVLDESEPNPTFSMIHSTVAENGLALRERYSESTGRDAYRIGWFVHNLNWTDNQLKARFGLTDQNLAAAKAKLLALHDAYETVLEAAGE